MWVLAQVTVSSGFMVLAILAIAAQSILLLVSLFGRGPRYKVAVADLQNMNADDFLRTVEAITDARLSRQNGVAVLANGENFYEAELQEIAKAQRTICLEAYIFNRGEVANRLIRALTERARAGVRVQVVLDGIGSASTRDDDFKVLIAAGGKLKW